MSSSAYPSAGEQMDAGEALASQVPSEVSDNGSDTEQEQTSDEEEMMSGDGQEPMSGEKRDSDDDQPPSASAGVVASSSSSAGAVSKPDFDKYAIPEDVVEQLIKGATLDDLSLLEAELKNLAISTVERMKKVGEEKKRIEKEARAIIQKEKKAERQKEKQQETRVEKERLVVINLSINGESKTIEVKNSATVKDLRDTIAQKFLSGMTKKQVKKMRLLLNNNNDLCEAPRKTVKGLHLSDTDVFHIQLGIVGGGKRGFSTASDKGFTKADRIYDIKETVGSALLRVSSNNGATPAITDLANAFSAIIETIDTNPSNVFAKLTEQLDKTTLLEMSGALTSNNPQTKISSMTSIIFKEKIDTLKEVKKQMKMVEGCLSPCVEGMLVAQFGDPAGNISWMDLSKFIIGKISSKPSEGGSSLPM